MQKYNNRSEVPLEYKWDLTPFFKDDKDFENKFLECSKLVSELKNFKNCTKDANKLYEFLIKQVNAIALWEDLYVYSYLINDQELGVEASIVRKNKTEKLEGELMSNCSFFAPELLKLSKDEYERFLQPVKLSEVSYDEYIDSEEYYSFQNHLSSEFPLYSIAKKRTKDVSSKILKREKLLK